MERHELGAIIDELTIYTLLVSCGITMEIVAENLFNVADSPTSVDLVNASEELHQLSTVLASICAVNENQVRKIVVRLGEEFRAVEVKNPLYVPPRDR